MPLGFLLSVIKECWAWEFGLLFYLGSDIDNQRLGSRDGAFGGIVGDRIKGYHYIVTSFHSAALYNEISRSKRTQ